MVCLWRELNEMKEKIDNCQKSLFKYKIEVWPRMSELEVLIRKEKKLCNEICKEELQKHLDICSSSYKCKDNIVSHECQFKENGRCSHFYEIENLTEDLDDYECIIHQEEIRIIDLEVEYDRALAIKEDRLKEYFDKLDDWL